jgi:predicted secreted hydrolase
MPSKAKRILVALSVLALLAGGVAAFWWATLPRASDTGPVALGNVGDSTGFARALAPRPFTFPADYGPHFDYQTEWWYYTGNLTTASGQHVGYQLTIFRRGLTPGAPASRPSEFSSNQVFFAHLAFSDVAAGNHAAYERFSRGALDLAGASGDPYGAWLEDWRVESMTPDGSAVHLAARSGPQSLDLELRAVKPIVAHGDHGLSPKSEAPGNASYYLSYTRLATTGSVSLANGQNTAVSGESWFDHEWSTTALGPGAVGWDWFSLQLTDGRELMWFQIRQQDGSLERVSGGTLVAPDGGTRRLALGDATVTVLDHWGSPVSGGVYPSHWRLSVPSAQLSVDIVPWLADQENRLSFAYWEGAVRITGNSGVVAVTGNGYVEMTGYATSIAGRF